MGRRALLRTLARETSRALARADVARVARATRDVANVAKTNGFAKPFDAKTATAATLATRVAMRGFAANAGKGANASAKAQGTKGKFAAMKPRGKGTNAKAKGGEGEGGRAKDGAKEGAEAPKTLAELMRGPSGQQIASLAMLAVAMSLLSATRSDAREI